MRFVVSIMLLHLLRSGPESVQGEHVMCNVVCVFESDQFKSLSCTQRSSANVKSKMDHERALISSQAHRG